MDQNKSATSLLTGQTMPLPTLPGVKNSSRSQRGTPTQRLGAASPRPRILTAGTKEFERTLYRDYDRHPSPTHGDSCAISFLLRAATADDVNPAYRGGSMAKRGAHQTDDAPYETTSPQTRHDLPYLYDDEESEADNRKLPAHTPHPAEMDVVNQLLSLRDTCLPTASNRPAAQVTAAHTILSLFTSPAMGASMPPASASVGAVDSPSGPAFPVSGPTHAMPSLELPAPHKTPAAKPTAVKKAKAWAFKGYYTTKGRRSGSKNGAKGRQASSLVLPPSAYLRDHASQQAMAMHILRNHTPEHAYDNQQMMYGTQEAYGAQHATYQPPAPLPELRHEAPLGESSSDLTQPMAVTAAGRMGKRARANPVDTPAHAQVPANQGSQEEQGASTKKRRTLLGEDFLDEAQMDAFIDTDDRAFSMGAAGPKKGKGSKRRDAKDRKPLKR